jgi:Zn-dependent protease with chaperone function
MLSTSCRRLLALAFATVLLAPSWPEPVGAADRGARLGEGPPDDVVLTARRSNYVREGPGSFHPVVVAVKKDVPLETLKRKDGWIRVRLPDDRTGWIAKTSVRSGRPTETASLNDAADDWASTEATESGVAAAVRGFQMRVDDLAEGSTKELLTYLKSTPAITERDVEHFRRPLDAGDRSDLDLGELDLEFEPFDPTVKERQVGYAVASRLVGKGLVRAPRVQRYLTLMTEQLTAETPYYNVEFDVVLIEGDGPDAFACPGGILFLTRGVFRHFENEAQLAGLVAHEIAHVVRHHGMAEMDERSVRRKAKDAFAELEQATGEDEDKYQQVEEDLAKMMEKSYERVVNDRLLKYETEADRIAASLLGEAGYSPMGIVNAVQRITALRANDPGLFDETYLETKNARERLRSVKRYVEANDGDEDGMRLRRRFQAYDDEVR